MACCACYWVAALSAAADEAIKRELGEYPDSQAVRSLSREISFVHSSPLVVYRFPELSGHSARRLAGAGRMPLPPIFSLVLSRALQMQAAL